MGLEYYNTSVQFLLFPLGNNKILVDGFIIYFVNYNTSVQLKIFFLKNIFNLFAHEQTIFIERSMANN